MYKNVESLWLGTARELTDTIDHHSPVPPILGCLQITMLCKTLGSLCTSRSRATERILSSSKVYFRNTGSSTPRAWPILLTDRAGGTRSLAGVSGVAVVMDEGSRKYRILSPELRK